MLHHRIPPFEGRLRREAADAGAQVANLVLGAQDARVVGGSQLISIRMAEELGDKVVLDAPVRRIAYEPGLPPVREGLMQRMPMGSMMKVEAVYERVLGRSGVTADM